MSRLHATAVAALAVVAAVAAVVAAVLGGGDAPPADPHLAPTDPLVGLDLPAGVAASTGRLQQDGLTRSWLLLTPVAAADPTSLPLLVVLHGRNATPADEAARDELLPQVAAGRAVLVYPTGVNQAWNVDDGCCGQAAGLGLDDVAFVGQVTDTVRAQLRLTGPTDLVGFSNGGRMVYAIACKDVSRYDALVTVAAAPTTPGPCPSAAVPKPLFAAVQLDDTELPTDEHPRPVPGVLAALVDTWTARDRCPGSPTTATPGRATVRTWTGCAAGTRLQTVSWPRGGHIWPQVVDVGHPTAAELVWDFLQPAAT